MDRYDPNDDLYARLGAPDSATQDELKRIYRERVRLVHPDGHRAPELADREMKAINSAWEVLGDPLKRRAYDELRATWRLRQMQPEIDRRVAAEVTRLNKTKATRPRAARSRASPRPIVVRQPGAFPARTARRNVPAIPAKAASTTGFLQRIAADKVSSLRQQGRTFESVLLGVGAVLGDAWLASQRTPPRRPRGGKKRRRR